MKINALDRNSFPCNYIASTVPDLAGRMTPTLDDVAATIKLPVSFHQMHGVEVHLTTDDVAVLNDYVFGAVEDAPWDEMKPLTALDFQAGGDHYKHMTIQPVEFCQKNALGFLESCVIKRMCRHDRKNGIEDLRKARHELELLAELEYGVKL